MTHLDVQTTMAAEHKAQINSLNQHMSDISSSYQKRLSELKENLHLTFSEISKDFETKLSWFGRMERSIMLLNDSYKKTVQALKHNDHLIRRLDIETSDLKFRSFELKEELDRTLSLLSDSKIELSAKIEEINNLENEMKTLVLNNGIMRKENEELNSTISLLNYELETSLEIQKESIQDKLKSMETMQSDIHNKAVAIDQLQMELEASQSLVLSLNDKLQHLDCCMAKNQSTFNSVLNEKDKEIILLNEAAKARNEVFQHSILEMKNKTMDFILKVGSELQKNNYLANQVKSDVSIQENKIASLTQIIIKVWSSKRIECKEHIKTINGLERDMRNNESIIQDQISKMERKFSKLINV